MLTSSHGLEPYGQSRPKLIASDFAANSIFGFSLEINGDTLVIGAPDDFEENNSDSGRAYVYTRSGNLWTEQAKLISSDGAADDFFGGSVASDGDTIVIGASSHDTESGNNAGGVYIFE